MFARLVVILCVCLAALVWIVLQAIELGTVLEGRL